MTTERVTAWAVELQTIHHRLEEALRSARSATARASIAGDLLTHCYAFCGALTDHHQREDAGLFVRLLKGNPGLESVIAQLKADHLILADLIADFEATLAKYRDSDSVDRAHFDTHLNALHSRMSAHFSDEERRLDNALDHLATTRSEAVKLAGDGRNW